NLLRAELAALQEQNFDLDVIGFSKAELAQLLAEQDLAGLRNPDAVPAAPKTAVAALGDVWLLGDHRLLCGDAVSKQASDVVLGGRSAHMVFTDLSHDVSRQGNAARGPKIDNK